MRRRAVILLLAPALAGCTQTAAQSGSFKGDEKRVAQVVSDLSANASKRKSAETCDQLLSKALRDRLAAGGQCASELRKAFEDADRPSLDVKDVTLTGRTATARVASGDRGRTVSHTFRLVLEDGRWRIDAFG